MLSLIEIITHINRLEKRYTQIVKEEGYESSKLESLIDEIYKYKRLKDDWDNVTNSTSRII